MSEDSLAVNGTVLSPFLQPRVSGTAGNKIVQDHIIKTFKDLNWHVEEDSFEDNTPFGIKSFKNIIVTKDIHAQRRLSLAAHFDSKYFKNFEFIGATDSSIPCAILVNLARSLNNALENQMKTSRFTTLQLIFFDGEEAFVEWDENDSIYGARHLASKWQSTRVQIKKQNAGNMVYDRDSNKLYTSPIEQMDAMILLDLLGTKDAKVPNTHPETGWIFDRLVDIQKRLVTSKFVSENLQKRVKNPYDGGIFQHGYLTHLNEYSIQDDHVPFFRIGVPICHIIPYPFPSVWHTTNDNADSIDEATVSDLALIFRVLVVEYLGLDLYLHGEL